MLHVIDNFESNESISYNDFADKIQNWSKANPSRAIIPWVP
jgi:hypothetical protein